MKFQTWRCYTSKSLLLSGMAEVHSLLNLVSMLFNAFSASRDRFMPNCSCSSRRRLNQGSERFSCSIDTFPAKVSWLLCLRLSSLLIYSNTCLMQVTAIGSLSVSPQQGKFDVRVESPSVHLRYFKWIRSVWSDSDAIVLRDVLLSVNRVFEATIYTRF